MDLYLYLYQARAHTSTLYTSTLTTLYDNVGYTLYGMSIEKDADYTIVPSIANALIINEHMSVSSKLKKNYRKKVLSQQLGSTGVNVTERDRNIHSK